MTILNSAVARGDLETVKKLIETDGYTANYAGFFGLIDIYPLPIKVAVENNQPEILEYLIQKGANINGNEGIYESPIIIANAKGYIKVGAVLLKHDLILPDWLTKAELLKRYMIKAVESNDAATVETLLNYTQANIDTTEFNYSKFDKMSLLHKAAYYEATDVVSKLIEMGANVNLLDKGNHTPIHSSVLKGNIDIVNLLLESGGKIDFAGSKNFTPLMLATCFNDEKHSKMIEFLIKNGANVNAISEEDGWSPLIIAAGNNNVHAVNTLIEAGADVTHKNLAGQNAADVALKYGYIEMANTLNLHNAESANPNVDDNIELIQPIKINEVLMITAGNERFASDVIDHSNNSLFSGNHTQLTPVQVSTYIAEINATLNQTIEHSLSDFG